MLMSTELEFVQGFSPLFSQLHRYVFNWNELPGMDNGILVEFLTRKFGIDWIKNAKIEKICGDKKTVKVSTENNHLSLELKKKNTELDLKIDDGRIYTFKAKACDDKLNIYLQPLKSPLAATAYYTFLIKRFPTNFKAIYQEAKEVMGSNINQSKLRNGRRDLLELGFISQVLPVNDESIDFNREMFLPISPELIWQDNVEKLNGIITPNGIEQRSALAKELQEIYEANFGKYGVRIEKGSVTVFHSSQWLLYYLASNIKNNTNIRMLLGTLGSFEEPYIKYYKNMLMAGLNTKIICDPINKEVNRRVKNIMKLKKIYPQKIEIRATPISHGTSRRMIYDNMAIDGKKLAGFNSDLSYISTIYFQEHIVARMQNNFETAFQNSLELKDR